MLKNPSFEEGWYHPGDVAELQIPAEWQFWYATNSTPNPIDPAPWSQFQRPEVRVLPRTQLPDDERELFVLDGDHTLKIFKGSGAWMAGFSQVVDLSDGGMYRLTVRVFPDLVKAYTPDGKVWADDPQGRDGMLRFTLDGNVGVWQPVAPPDPGSVQGEEHWRTFTLDFVAEGETMVGVDLMCPFALINSGFFADRWTLEKLAAPPASGRGAPRVQYLRRYHLLAPGATREQAHQVLDGIFDQGGTLGKSADDAGIGDLDERYVVGHYFPQDLQPSYQGFFREHYPGVQVSFEDTPDVPPDPEPPVDDHFTLLTFHAQTPVPGWQDAVRRLAEAGKPLRTFKIVHVSMESAREIAALSPETEVVYRFVDDNQKPYLDNPDKKAAAKSFLDKFLPGARNVPEIARVESINETYATHDLDGIAKAAAFDAAFCEVLAQETHGEVKAVVMTAPPGNPDHGSEVELMLPAAEAAYRYGAWVGGHTYAGAVPAPGVPEHWLETEGLHYHLRPLLSWKPVFERHGYYLQYFFGEFGFVAVHVRDDGRPGGFAGAELGWRSGDCLAGNLERCVNLNLRYQEQLRAFPEVVGAAFFTTGTGIGWRHYLFNSEWAYQVDRMLE